MTPFRHSSGTRINDQDELKRSIISLTRHTWNPPHGRHKPGRPRTTWERTFINDLRAIDIAWDEAEAAAADRVCWRTLAAQCAERRRRT